MAVHFFTSRLGGVSSAPFNENNLALHVGDNPGSVHTNRTRLREERGPTLFMEQVHGNYVALVEGSTSIEPRADAMVTQEAGLSLAVLTADCIPLLMWDAAHSCVAAVHVGRRGLVNEVALQTVRVMQALGATEISALLGPAICGNCYEVGEDIFTEVVALLPEAESRTVTGGFALDLPRALASQLSNLGVTSALSGECTVENRNYFSYRRDGVTGRCASLISL